MPPTNVKKLGKYDVLELIGRGGMGVVFKATDPSLNRLVAIKMMSGAFADDADLLKRFYREAQSTASLHHANIVTVYDMGEHDGNPYIVMELLEGESLQEVIDQKRPLPLLQKVNYILQVCRGLEYAHARQIVHRDIKPANVVVLRDSSVKIVDFGIAHMGDLRVTRPGLLLGSVEYMSPEQLTEGTIDRRTDIFAVGVLLFQLVTYELPFHGQDVTGTLMKIIHDFPPRLSKFLASYPEELDAIVQRALAKDKEERYQSVEELAFDLHQVEGELRRHFTQEILQRSTEFMAREQWTEAREQLLEVLRLDPQNPEANHRMREVQQYIQIQRRKEQARELKVRAETLVTREQFTPAMRLLEEAMSLDDSPDLGQFRDKVKELSERIGKLQSAMQRAQLARRGGDLDRAMQAIEEALVLQPDHKEALAMRGTLANEIAARCQSRELRQLIESARKNISERRFADALSLLKRVEELDANAPVLRQLKRMASEGLEQEDRRRELQVAIARIEDALNAADFDTASACLRDALQRFPAESSLINLKALTERQRERHERRVWVENCMASAHKYLNEGHPEEALAKLEDAARRYPTEPVVQSLLAMVQQSVAQQRKEKRKSEVMELAKDAIRRKAFDEAVERLEAARAELSTPDFDDLIAFAHDKAEAHKGQERVTAIANRAQALFKNHEYAQAIELLGNALREAPDEELRFLLEDAKVRLQEQQRIEQDIIDRADQLLEQDRAEDAVALLEEERGLFANLPPYTAALDRAERKRQWSREITEQEQVVKLALTSGNFDKAEGALQECRRRFGERPEFARLQQQLERGRRDVHRAAVEKAMSDAMLLAKIGSLEEGLQALERAADSVRYLLPEEMKNYENYAERLRADVHLQHEQAEGRTHDDAAGRPLKREDVEGTERKRRQEEEERQREKARQERERVGAEQERRLEGQRGSPYLRTPLMSLKAAFSRRRSEADARANAEQHEHSVQELTPPSGIAAPNATGPEDIATDLNSQLPTRKLERRVGRESGRVVRPVRSDEPVDETRPTLDSRSATAPTLTPTVPNRAPSGPLASLAPERGEIHGTSTPPPNAQRWPDDVLRHVEKQLALYLGPLAKVIVRRAASRTADWNELHMLVAESLESESERQAFLACKDEPKVGWGAPETVERTGASPVGAPSDKPSRDELSRAVISHATRSLARYIGPISSVLVGNAAQRADSVRDLYFLLADELENEAERTRFLREAGILDEK